MKHITIIGCGLIGGSFAALVKKFHQNCHLLGIGRRKDPLETAIKEGIIDEYELNISTNKLESTDLIILATPISTILPTIEKLTKNISKPLTIVDFSSVKSFLDHPIVNSSHHDIIALHPMGGREVQGLENASAAVLEGCPLITFDKNPESKINSFFKSCHFNLVYCASFKEHDEWMTFISHGPYLVAGLIPILLSQKTENELTSLNKISAGGFKDTTRVIGSPVEWGLDILAGNKGPLLDFLNNIEKTISKLKQQLNNNDLNELETTLKKAKKTRQIIVDGK